MGNREHSTRYCQRLCIFFSVFSPCSGDRTGVEIEMVSYPAGETRELQEREKEKKVADRHSSNQTFAVESDMPRKTDSDWTYSRY